ncbi:MAG TPA: ion channel [Candidatus Saccharimonadales bacterium]|nr:ion channel [Candidatus Saccharimonadales bacterium]
MFFFALFGVIIILAILVDAFEAIVLPRRVNRRIRLSRLFYKTFWKLWLKGKHFITSKNPYDIKAYLGIFGPLSLIVLITIWAIALIFGFAFINFGLQTDIESPHNARDFVTYFYLSGGTFFPVGLADTYPLQVPGKLLAIIESGIGFAFLAMVIGYLPVLYQAFSRREVNINLLDSHAGSPPSAIYLLQNISNGDTTEELKTQFENWEQWCAELLETHISYPVLAYYRSQHDNQSWVAALLMILDASSLVLASKNHALHSKAKSTFAIARHAAVDLTQAFYLEAKSTKKDRLSEKDFMNLRKLLKETDFPLRDGHVAAEKITHMRKLYEPYLQALSDFFIMSINPFITNEKVEEAWRRSI